jgi:hypothetical protein
VFQELHYHTVEQGTLGVLKALFRLSELDDARLVGGTALALLLGHRNSIDLDVFGNINLPELTNANVLEKVGSFTLLKSSASILTAIIDEVKVDIVNYNFPWIEEPIYIDGLRLAGIKDIGAMKLAAITGRGTRKDFIDLYFLLKHFCLDELMQLYCLKYKEGTPYLVLKSLTYFEDAENDESPKMFDNVKWDHIKTKINTVVRDFLSENT